MNKLIYFLLFPLFFASCEDDKEISYKNRLTLSGITTEAFSRLGEVREYSIVYTSTPIISDKDAEEMLKSSEILFFVDNNNFTFSDYTIVKNELKFKLVCTENKTEDIIEDKIRILITNSRFCEEVTAELKQEGSEIRYEYKIESKIIDTYILPAAGGTFTIPIQGKRLTYINDNLESDVPYSLKGIHFISNFF